MLYVSPLLRWRLVFRLIIIVPGLSREVSVLEVLRGNVRTTMLRLPSILGAALLIMRLVNRGTRGTRPLSPLFIEERLVM